MTARTLTLAIASIIAAGALALGTGGGTASADPAAPPPAAAHAPRPGAPGPSALIDPRDAIVLLLDHQTGLFQTVKDIPISRLRTNVTVLAKIAELSRLPIYTTASEPRGPNGPLMPELATAAPGARYIPRRGEVSAWDNPDFRSAVRASGRRTLVMAGVWTSVCLAFPAVQARAEGYTVYAVIDASGDVSEVAQRAAIERMVRAGVIVVTTNAILGELQRTWARPDAARWSALYSELVPGYRAVSESFQGARGARP